MLEFYSHLFNYVRCAPLVCIWYKPYGIASYTKAIFLN